MIAFARRFNLKISGGSDYHGDLSHGAAAPGSVTLPREDYERLKPSHYSGFQFRVVDS